MTAFDDTGSRQRPTAYTETGADLITCMDCSAPVGYVCRWIAADGVPAAIGQPRHFPHESRWRR